MFDLFDISIQVITEFGIFIITFILLFNIGVTMLYEDATRHVYLKLGNTSFLLMLIVNYLSIRTGYSMPILYGMFGLLAITFFVYSTYSIFDFELDYRPSFILNMIHLGILFILYFVVDKFTIYYVFTMMFSFIVIAYNSVIVIRQVTEDKKLDSNIIASFTIYALFLFAGGLHFLYLSFIETGTDLDRFSFVIIMFGTILFVIWVNFSLFLSTYNLLSIKYKRLSMQDDLTKLHNRRYVILEIEKSILLARRELLRFGLVFIDINGFKEINDVHGHLIGDYYLKEFSDLMKKFFRSSDIVSRFGGDEFLLLIHVTSEVDLFNTVERFTNYSKQIKLTSHKLPVQFSAGSLYIDEAMRDKNVDEILSIVDKKMYQLKNKSK